MESVQRGVHIREGLWCERLVVLIEYLAVGFCTVSGGGIVHRHEVGEAFF